MGVSVPSRTLEAVRPHTKLAHVDDIVAEIGNYQHVGGNLQVPFHGFAMSSMVATMKHM
jgi:hypothetical protein